MSMMRRILEAVTPGRVALALLIGAFARDILTVLGWSAGIGWGLAQDDSVRGLLGAGGAFALEVALIYLAIRGLGAGLGRLTARSVERADSGTHQGEVPTHGTETTVDEAAARPREGGRDGGDREQ